MPPQAAHARAAGPTPAAGAAYSGRAILVAFAAVVASFMAATAYSVVQTQRIDAMSDSIASISMVGIEHLAEIRTSARTLESLADAVRPGTRPGEEWKSELREASDELALHADTYRVLPLYVGEDLLWAELGAAADDLDAAVKLALADDPAGTGRIH
ncbi:MAG TPA: hypothetical protein VIW03_01755, partial [Anaeromyxobacter sp.]